MLLPVLCVLACIEEPPAVEMDNLTTGLDEITFADFNFETAREIELKIEDPGNTAARYAPYYDYQGVRKSLGSYSKQAYGLQASLSLPTSLEALYVVKTTSLGAEDYLVMIKNGTARLAIEESVAGSANGNNLSQSAGQGCIDHLYAVNNNGHFFTIDVSNSDFARNDLSNLQGGGSIANALDQANGILYYNVGTTLYAYDIDNETFSVRHKGNPFNGSYPRLEYKDGFFYMANGTKMYKVNAETNEVVVSYKVSGFINNSSGGDLAFDSNGDLYLACFSGLYRFTSLNDGNGTATITRISAENFPFQLTSMAIDRQDRIFVGTNDSNSNLIQISKEDGAYTIVKTFDRKINDLTAWKCEASDLDQQDSDNDGIIDELDDYPDDPDAATDVFTPSALGMGTYAFEDLWPLKGDYDFNDMVIGYRYTNVLNAENNCVRMKMNFTLRAVGAGFHSGFGIELNVPKNLIASVAGHKTAGANTSLDAKGLEAGQDKSVVIVFNDSFNHMQPAAGARFINTDPAEGTVTPFEVEVVVEFINPIDPALIGNAPFNPFIFSSTERGKEIHLAGKSPTSLADNSYFGTENDDSNLGAGKTYQDANNLPWAIHIIHEFRYPTEKARIDQGYNRFVDWGRSQGALYNDWYGDNSGYRNTNRLYFRN